MFSQPKGDQPALQTPRMSLEVYNEQKNVAIQQLRGFFEVVVAPAEAPEKDDYGDVDILVQGPKVDFTWHQVASTLNARRAFHNGDSHSFAIPINDTTYAQVDVHICAPSFVEWECFLDSYGDLMQIMGRFLRPLGLTATDKGLHVRIAEIESRNRKSSMLYLSHSVEDVLGFLGLDIQQYRKGFESLEDLFSWFIGGKFFHPSAITVNNESANDRQRMRKRPMFRMFNDEWLPRNADRWGDKQPSPREDILCQALACFGRRAEYEEKVAAWNAEKDEEELWSNIAAVISGEGQRDINIVIRGLKRWVYFDPEGHPSVRNEAEMDPEQQPCWTSHLRQVGNGAAAGLSKDSLFEWVCEHWQEVKGLEKDRISTAKFR